MHFPISTAFAEESFRVFKTPSGKSFEGKVVGYEGVNFILTNKSVNYFRFHLTPCPMRTRRIWLKLLKQRIRKGRPAPKATATVSKEADMQLQKVDFHSEIMPIAGSL